MRAIRSTFRTKAETILVTERLHRNGELNLLECQVFQRNRPSGVKLDIELFLRGDLHFLVFLSGSLGTRPESYVKLRRVRKRIRVETTRTVQVDHDPGIP